MNTIECMSVDAKNCKFLSDSLLLNDMYIWVNSVTKRQRFLMRLESAVLKIPPTCLDLESFFAYQWTAFWGHSAVANNHWTSVKMLEPPNIRSSELPFVWPHLALSFPLMSGGLRNLIQRPLVSTDPIVRKCIIEVFMRVNNTFQWMFEKKHRKIMRNDIRLKCRDGEGQRSENATAAYIVILKYKISRMNQHHCSSSHRYSFNQVHTTVNHKWADAWSRCRQFKCRRHLLQLSFPKLKTHYHLVHRCWTVDYPLNHILGARQKKLKSNPGAGNSQAINLCRNTLLGRKCNQQIRL